MGGLIQLVAYGEQDVYLTGDPKVTFFQAVYKRHTNFAMETIQQTINGNIAPANPNGGNSAPISSNGRLTCIIARNGDLIGQMYIELQSNTVSLGTNVYSGYSTTAGVLDGTSWMAERSIQDIELSIGGQKIDKHYQRWWRLYSELYLDETKKIQYGKLTSNPNLTTGNSQVFGSGTVYLPLLFFFNRNPGLYLPLIALQYHEVRLDFDISNEFQTYFNPNVFIVWGNYVYLDTEERKMFAQKGHEYLIEQLQYTGASALTATVGNANLPRVTYNHPVKELVWCVTQNLSGGKQLWDFTSNAANSNCVILTTCPTQLGAPLSNVVVPISYATGTPMQLFPTQQANQYQWCEDGTKQYTSYGPVSQFKLIINGQDRMKAQTGKYYNQVQPFYHHTGNPYPGIYSYSFAIKPEEHQPSGTCNFSRVDNSQVSITLKTGISQNSFLEMFAVNYNVLRIQSGMGGLAFSN
jgi:hypothetical protein